MPLEFDFTNASAAMLTRKHGFTLRELSALQKRGGEIHRGLLRRRRNAQLGFYDLPYDDLLVNTVRALAVRVRRQFEHFVLLGIGGSALGAITLVKALAHPYHNLLPQKHRALTPRMFFLDNPDPESITLLLDVIDLRKTVFNVVTKSGDTAETISAFMYFFDRVSRLLGAAATRERFIATTSPRSGWLSEFSRKQQLKMLPIPANVGGRFSVLSAVGLFPAAVAGIDVRQIVRGAAAMDRRCRFSDLKKNPAYLNAAIHFLADQRKGKTISVLMPYASALQDVADWYRQLWAESLGKRFDLAGREVFVGQTPIRSLGATDQHSQLQLYLEGPNDKIVTFLRVGKFRANATIPRPKDEMFRKFDNLAGKNISDLLDAEFLATEFVLTKNRRPNICITLDTISPQTLGELLFFYEVQTAFAAGLYNINAFDQPAVEEGKILTHALMGRNRPEDEAKRREFTRYLERRKRSRCLS
jgi:glucose-6-phosphate isomerase